MSWGEKDVHFVLNTVSSFSHKWMVYQEVSHCSHEVLLMRKLRSVKNFLTSSVYYKYLLNQRLTLLALISVNLLESACYAFFNVSFVSELFCQIRYCVNAAVQWLCDKFQLLKPCIWAPADICLREWLEFRDQEVMPKHSLTNL